MSDLRRIIWIASYPKSGNTWMRLLLAHYFLPRDVEVDINTIYRFTTADGRQDFFNRAAGRAFHASDVNEWLEMRPKALRLIAASKPDFHFVKTHSLIGRMGETVLIPPEVTAAAVYMMRNPFDLALSYARHQGVGIDEAIGMMADPNEMNASKTNIFEVIGRWDSHVHGWTSAQGLNCHVIRYEDMLADTERSIRGLLAFLNAPVQDGQLRRAIRLTRFSELQKQEKQQGFRERPPQMKQFFAKGAAGGWRDELTPAQVARIRAEFLPAIEKWYPEMLAETEAFAEGAA
jgi:hypothetical protein